MSDYYQRSLELHRQHRGKLSIASRVKLESRDDLSIAYTPGVASVCQHLTGHPEEARSLTMKGNSVAVVTDGSAVLGLGNIGPLGALPVMEGKAILFKTFADVDAFPICLDTQNTDAIIDTIRNIAPTFGGINLEDISAPRCFEIEERLQDLGIPVFHDDQHGTAIVLLAAIINATRVVGKEMPDLKVVINGAGAAGTAIAKLLSCQDADPNVCVAVRDVIVCDSHGAIHEGRDNLNEQKRKLLSFTNAEKQTGNLYAVLKDADVFIGVSRGGLLGADQVRSMANDAIILALANPEPEIMPDEAFRGGAAVVGTGRSDFPNQINNVLVFPGIFRGALDVNASHIDMRMKLSAARGLADVVGNPEADRILPDPLDKRVAPVVAAAVRQVAEQD